MRLLLLAMLALPADAGERILFVGNSLTSAHDLPGVVCRLADAAGVEARCEAVTRPNASLDDHLAAGTFAQRMVEERPTRIVLQQGPSALPESRAALRASARRMAEIAHRHGARVALYAPWPWRSRSADSPRVGESYRLAAEDIGALVLDAGGAWQAAWRRDARIKLYSGDSFHPSPAGTYLAALVIYRGLFGALPKEFAERVVAERAIRAPLAVSDAQLRTLMAAASE